MPTAPPPHSRAALLGLLGLSPASDDAESIRKAYKTLARKYHPDKQAGATSTEESTRRYQEVQDAYQKLVSTSKEGAAEAAAGDEGGECGVWGAENNMPGPRDGECCRGVSVGMLTRCVCVCVCVCVCAHCTGGPGRRRRLRRLRCGGGGS
jgi:hypothetical protein